VKGRDNNEGGEKNVERLEWRSLGVVDVVLHMHANAGLVHDALADGLRSFMVHCRLKSG
jgi:hypothetical protein